MDEIIIRVFPVECKTEDGKKFTAWETTDTKDKTRLSVSFVDGKCKPPTGASRISVCNAFVDKRKRYPVLRVREYDIIETAETKSGDEWKKLF